MLQTKAAVENRNKIQLLIRDFNRNATTDIQSVVILIALISASAVNEISKCHLKITAFEVTASKANALL